jgi:hypothetical protein
MCGVGALSDAPGHQVCSQSHIGVEEHAHATGAVGPFGEPTREFGGHRVEERADGAELLRERPFPSIANMPATPKIGESFTPSVSTTGDGAKTVTSSTTDVCTVNGSGVVSFIAEGTCALTAHVAEGAAHQSADGSAQSVSVVPPAPALGSVSSTKPRQVFITWSEFVPHTGRVLWYRAFVYQVGTLTKVASCKGTASDRSCTAVGLTPATDYEVRTRARIGYGGGITGWSSLSEPMPFTTPPTSRD